MPAKTRKMSEREFAPDRLDRIEVADTAFRAAVNVGILLYRNLNVQTHEVMVEGKPFKLVASDDGLTDDQKPWLHLFTGQATVDVQGGLDVWVRITGQRAPRPSLPQGQAWLVVKIDGNFIEPRLEPACGATGVGEAQFTYALP